MRGPRRRTVAAAGAVLATVAVVGAGSPAVAGGSPGTTVATGLNNPRHLTFNSAGDLFIAEAGRGGPGPCVDGPEGRVCLGWTGSVTSVSAATGTQRRVLQGLPSLAGEGGTSASGPTDITLVGDKTFALSMGLGNNPAARADLGPGAAKLGTVIVGRLGVGNWVLTDVAKTEARNDWDGQGPDSNPGGMTLDGDHLVIADSGANTVSAVTLRGAVRPLAVLPNRMVPTPPFMPPGMMPMQSVPTSVTKGPDGALYVSELTGFPFPVGYSRILRVVPGQAPTVYAKGLTNVTDLAWRGGMLYAVQLANKGLLAVPEGQLPTGSLVGIRADGSKFTVAGGLPAPYGVAFKDGDAYVTTCTVCAGGGAVTRIDMD